jgi:hypothetical protein
MVKKRDGRKETFLPEKIVVSAVKSGAPPEYARTIAQTIGRLATENVSTQEIRTKVLADLESRNPDWKKSWLEYDALVKKGPA